MVPAFDQELPGLMTTVVPVPVTEIEPLAPLVKA
jgi:hypothetical protein